MIRKFQIGDRVQYVPKRAGDKHKHLTPLSGIQCEELAAHPYGTVRGFYQEEIEDMIKEYAVVEFDQLSTGHSCGGVVSGHKGLYIDLREMEYESVAKVTSISKLI